MWFVFALMTTLAWGGADVFYKLGSDSDDRYSHLKIAVAVGTVMGLHALVYYFAADVQMNLFDVVKYLPVSFCYILSMVVGYIGLRYLALSIASPVQNTSGVIVTVLMVAFFGISVGAIEIAGIVIITLGLVLLAIFENHYGEKITLENKRYKLSPLAIIFPLIYCLIDALGTFADAVYLDELELISEDAALISYELTFFLVGFGCFVFLLVKGVKQRAQIRHSGDFGSSVYLDGEELKQIQKNKVKLRKTEPFKLIAAALETIGQFTYVFAMSSRAEIAAPLIASYSVFSVIFARLFLKEKLHAPQYAVIVVVLFGILMLGIAEGLG